MEKTRKDYFLDGLKSLFMYSLPHCSSCGSKLRLNGACAGLISCFDFAKSQEASQRYHTSKLTPISHFIGRLLDFGCTCTLVSLLLQNTQVGPVTTSSSRWPFLSLVYFFGTVSFLEHFLALF